MIQNVIFDMGNVLLKWDPAFITAAYSDDPATRKALRDATIDSPDWALMDAGMLSDEEARARALLRAPASLRALTGMFFDTWHTHMPPLPGAVDFLARLAEKGYGRYMLSNASERYPGCVEKEAFYPLLNGCIVSAQERLVKPDPLIFQRLLDRYGLTADTCVFVDDLMVNVRGAENVGMHGFQFDGDFDKLADALRGLGMYL